MESPAGSAPEGHIRLVCVDDSHLLIAAWERLLSAQPDIRVVGTSTSADGLVDLVLRRQPHVVMLDLTMRGRDALETISEIAASAPGSRVLVFSGVCDAAIVERCMAAGAWGFVAKHSDPLKVIAAVRAVAAGRVVLPDSLAD